MTPILLSVVRKRLLDLPDLTALVGTRIYSMRLPQSVTYPAVLLQEIDRVFFNHVRGDVNVFRSRIQVNSAEAEGHGDPYVGAHAVAQAIRGTCAAGSASGLAGWRGTIDGYRITGILADDQRERYEDAVRVVTVESDFIIWHKL